MFICFLPIFLPIDVLLIPQKRMFCRILKKVKHFGNFFGGFSSKYSQSFLCFGNHYWISYYTVFCRVNFPNEIALVKFLILCR
jgi:hypothetical protein